MEENSFEMESFFSDCSYFFSEDEGNSIIDVIFCSVSLFKLVVVQVTTVNYSFCLELETHGHEDSTQHPMELCENCAQPATVLCQRCANHYCSQCRQMRHQHPARRNNKLLALKNILHQIGHHIIIPVVKVSFSINRSATNVT